MPVKSSAKLEIMSEENQAMENARIALRYPNRINGRIERQKRKTSRLQGHRSPATLAHHRAYSRLNTKLMRSRHERTLRELLFRAFLKSRHALSNGSFFAHRNQHHRERGDKWQYAHVRHGNSFVARCAIRRPSASKSLAAFFIEWDLAA